jgi:putative ABC transport system ATP-binding protein
MEAPIILQCEALTRRFSSGDSEITALEGVDFTLREGEASAVLGPSGSGKSTFLALAAGLDIPSAGRVLLKGHDLGALNEDERAILRRDLVGFVFQNFQLLPTLTALENVLLPLEIAGKVDRPRALDLLARVGLSHRLHSYPTQLSGGEQQRVALARAFIHSPQIIFADEPTGSLDAENATRALEYMFELQEKSKTALVLVTHDLELAKRLPRHLTLFGGRVRG